MSILNQNNSQLATDDMRACVRMCVHIYTHIYISKYVCVSMYTNVDIYSYVLLFDCILRSKINLLVLVNGNVCPAHNDVYNITCSRFVTF